MNKKYLFSIFAIFIVMIAGGWFYQKYNQFIPTANAAIHVKNLSQQDITLIRQNTPITEVKVYKSARIVQLMHHDQKIQSYPMRLGFTPKVIKYKKVMEKHLRDNIF